MRTDELIRALATDGARSVVPIDRSLRVALLTGIALSVMLFVVTLHTRSDLALAFSLPGFCLKLIVTVLLAASCIAALSDAARPISRLRCHRLLLAPSLLVAAVVFELSSLPAHVWSTRLIGHNAPHCLSLIPLLSLAPAVCLLMALRRGAPSRPAVAGAIAGVLSGAVGATLYALTCPDDSPLFVATWYSIAILAVAGASTYAGSRILRW